jgi:hypothetical protein
MYYSELVWGCVLVKHGGLTDGAVSCYNNGYNCSQCVLKAAEPLYGIVLDKGSLNMCEGISNGFGVGGVCSVIVAGVMLYGILFDKDTLKPARMALISECCERFGSLDCAVIKKARKGKGDRACEDIVRIITGYIEKIAENYLIEK